MSSTLVLIGIGQVVYNVSQVSLRQAITPDAMLGRMNATMRFVVWGTMPIGAVIGGILGGAIGLRETLFVAAIGEHPRLPVRAPVAGQVAAVDREAMPASADS